MYPNHGKSNSGIILYLHWHTEAEMLIVTKGSATFIVDNRSFFLKQGDGLFIAPETLHYAISSSEYDCDFYAFVFQPEFIIDRTNKYLYSKYIKPVFEEGIHEALAFYSDNSNCESSIYNSLIRITTLSNSIESELVKKGILLEVWNEFYFLWSSHFQSTDKTNAKRMQPVLDYIHSNYSYKIELSNLADLIPLSEGQFCRSFKEIFHISPISYIMKYRIMKSCELLTISDKTIMEIASLCGFNNIGYFNRTFLAITGCTPSEYRHQRK